MCTALLAGGAASHSGSRTRKRSVMPLGWSPMPAAGAALDRLPSAYSQPSFETASELTYVGKPMRLAKKIGPWSVYSPRARWYVTRCRCSSPFASPLLVDALPASRLPSAPKMGAPATEGQRSHERLGKR